MPTLIEIETLARKAGEILRAGFGAEKRVYLKGEIDLVTDIDQKSEKLLIEEIQDRYPGHSIVAEESGETPGSSRFVWYLDPMDGTVNFAHGLPYFAVSIGYAEKGRMKFGVVYDPIRDECFSAQAGTGAWLNGVQLRASKADDLNSCLLTTNFGYDIRTHPQNNLDLFAYFSLNTWGVRRSGSAALDLCYVASGRVDGYWELRFKPWDVAAGGLIAVESGARVTKVDGDPDTITPPCSVLAATPGIHNQMLKIIKSFLV